jgi:hypothetical protein
MCKGVNTQKVHNLLVPFLSICESVQHQWDYLYSVLSHVCISGFMLSGISENVNLLHM